MPHSRSAAKGLRKSLRLHARNKSVKTHLKTRLKKFNAAIAAGGLDEAKKQALMLQRSYDKAVKQGIVHANNAARHVGAAQSKVGALAAGKPKS